MVLRAAQLLLQKLRGVGERGISFEAKCGQAQLSRIRPQAIQNPQQCLSTAYQRGLGRQAAAAVSSFAAVGGG